MGKAFAVLQQSQRLHFPTAGSALGTDTARTAPRPRRRGAGRSTGLLVPPGSGTAGRRGTPDSLNCGSLEGQGCFHMGISFGYPFLLENWKLFLMKTNPISLPNSPTQR